MKAHDMVRKPRPAPGGRPGEARAAHRRQAREIRSYEAEYVGSTLSGAKVTDDRLARSGVECQTPAADPTRPHRTSLSKHNKSCLFPLVSGQIVLCSIEQRRRVAGKLPDCC